MNTLCSHTPHSHAYGYVDITPLCTVLPTHRLVCINNTHAHSLKTRSYAYHMIATIRTYMCTCVYIDRHTHANTYTHTHTHAHMHARTHTHTYTYTHTHTRTHTPAGCWLWSCATGWQPCQHQQTQEAQPRSHRQALQSKPVQINLYCLLACKYGIT